MIDRKAATEAPEQPGILELIATGMSHILVVPWLLLVPILLEGWFLFAPGVNSTRLTHSLGSWFDGRNNANAADVARWFNERGGWDVSGLVGFPMASVIDALGSGDHYAPIDRTMFHPSATIVLICAVGFMLLGLFMLALFEVLLAHSMDLIRTQRRPLMLEILDRWLKFVSFVLFGTVAMLFLLGAVMIPIERLSAGGLSGDTIAVTLSLIGLAALVIAMFVPEAITTDGLWPIAALRASAEVVFHSFWRTLGFYVVSLLIGPGLLPLWKSMAHEAAGLILAILLNAWLVTSLAIATLGFYRSRSEQIRSLQTTIRG